MTAGLLTFGNLSLPMITTEDQGVQIFSTPYILYDGRTIVSGVSSVGKRPSFRGVAKGESFVNDILDEVSDRHVLTVNGKNMSVSQIISFDYNYDRYDGLQNIYKYRLGFATENLS